MLNKFEALFATKNETGQSTEWANLDIEDLMDGDVTIVIDHTTINYKDGLALTGKSPVIRKWPMIPGIDFAGHVETSTHNDYKTGDPVVLTGWGVGETHYGGYAQKARVKSDWLVPLPSVLDTSQAMAIGTAGFTAMLSVLTIEHHGITPANGPILVTGAAGGVGSVAVLLLARLGFEIIASTGRREEENFLKSLGASTIIDRQDLSVPGKPLGKERWAAAIDVAGSHTLANVIGQVKYGGIVAACGLAQGIDLPASVAPFLLRSVTLAGIDSVMAPKQRRLEAWQRLARDLDLDKLASLTQTRSWKDVITLAPQILEGKIRGRMVLEVDA